MPAMLNEPHLCLQAFRNFRAHAISANGDLNKDEFTKENDTVREFAKQAAAKLSDLRFAQLLELLNGSKKDPADVPRLEEDVGIACEDFYLREMDLSRQGRENFARPAGSLQADLGLVLHLETKGKGEDYGDFFGCQSETIKLIKDKGLTLDSVALLSDVYTGIKPRSVFAMDWHWRGETIEEYQQRKHCNFTKLDPKIKDVHNDFSWDLLEMVPCPLLIVGGVCARERMQHFLPSPKVLEVEKLTFCLDYRKNKLRRLILFLPHPSAPSNFGPGMQEAAIVQLDLGYDFMLWLTGQRYSVDSFKRGYEKSLSNNDGDMKTCSWYRDREQALGRILQANELDPGWLKWAGRYLDRDPLVIIATGESVVQLVSRRVCEKLSTARSEFERKRCANRKPAGTSSIQGGLVNLTGHGWATIEYVDTETPLKFRMSKSKADEIHERMRETSERLSVRITPESLQLWLLGTLVYTRFFKSWVLKVPKDKDMIDQINYELKEIGESPAFASSTCAADIQAKAVAKNHKTTSFEKRLMEGDWFARHKNGQYQLKRMAFAIPDAVEMVHFQGYLMPNGSVHPHQVCPDTRKEDAGSRLGILMTYDARDGAVKRWLTRLGPSNAKKVNKMVEDFVCSCN